MPKRDPETNLYPPLEPYNTGFLAVSELHTLYYEESGNPEGIPVIFLHGGPGYYSKPKDRQFFHPEKYRIILMDQRGCGKSVPAGELRENTTQHLAADLETLRAYLGIEQWHVFGGSWGSALALAYAETYPASVSALLVYGVYTTDAWMNAWFNGHGQDLIYPDAYAAFRKAVGNMSVQERLRILTTADRDEKLRIANAFNAWESAGMTLFPEDDLPETLSPEEQRAADDQSIQYALTFAHYEAHDFFLPEGFILRNADKLADIPGFILQGRYDLCCPVKAAWQLHEAWPEAAFTIVHHAAHRTEPPLAAALVDATDKMAEIWA